MEKSDGKGFEEIVLRNPERREYQTERKVLMLALVYLSVIDNLSV